MKTREGTNVKLGRLLFLEHFFMTLRGKILKFHIIISIIIFIIVKTAVGRPPLDKGLQLCRLEVAHYREPIALARSSVHLIGGFSALRLMNRYDKLGLILRLDTSLLTIILLCFT